jgi:hypothetical protein
MIVSSRWNEMKGRKTGGIKNLAEEGGLSDAWLALYRSFMPSGAA